MPYVIRPPVRKMSLAGALAMILLCALATASPSRADYSTDAVGATAPGCGPVALSNPFSIFGDYADYSIVDDGHFESGVGGWSLYGAGIVNGNESFRVRSASDSKSLSISTWGKAVSGAFCVDTNYPHFRFFAQHSDGPIGLLLVRARWTAGDGLHEESLALLRGSQYRSWGATEMLPLAEKVALSESGGTQSVRLVFIPLAGSWQIDDVYIDPYRR